MQAAIDETSRRRQKQVDFNVMHNITPKSVQTKIIDVMQGAREAANDTVVMNASERTRKLGTLRAAEPTADYASMTAPQLSAVLKRLEAQMFKHAQNLEFEDAARARDEMHRVREQTLRT